MNNANKFKIISSLIIISFICSLINSHNIEILREIQYKNYIKKCNDKDFFNHQYIKKEENIFLSICLPAYNMENYIESSLLSIINQSFQNFEIIIVNDNSNDNTKNIINGMQYKDKRIKCINHLKNLGVYASRADAILNSNGKYILLMDPDDMLINRNILREIYIYNKKFNLDIIEFLVYYQEEDEKKIYFPKNQIFSHSHNYNKKIIIQPDIIFYIPNTKTFNTIICRTIWNKLIRKEIIFNSIKYLNNGYFNNQFLIAADDTPINILSFQFANNYSNINLPGYLYNLRKAGMSTEKTRETNHNIILCYNYLLYFKFLFRYYFLYSKYKDI